MRRAFVVLFLSVAACATDEHAQERMDATRWDDLAHGLAALSADYCAAGPWTQPSCADVASLHAAAARGRVDEIRAMAGRMDEDMAELGATDLGDGVCTGEALLAELDRYAASSCAGSPTDAEAEARRHCTAILDLTAQMHLRSDVAMQAMTTTYYSGSGSMGMVPRRTSAGSHEWPWAGGERPVAAAVCTTH